MLIGLLDQCFYYCKFFYFYRNDHELILYWTIMKLKSINMMGDIFLIRIENTIFTDCTTHACFIHNIEIEACPIISVIVLMTP